MPTNQSHSPLKILSQFGHACDAQENLVLEFLQDQAREGDSAEFCAACADEIAENAIAMARALRGQPEPLPAPKQYLWTQYVEGALFSEVVDHEKALSYMIDWATSDLVGQYGPEDNDIANLNPEETRRQPEITALIDSFHSADPFEISASYADWIRVEDLGGECGDYLLSRVTL